MINAQTIVFYRMIPYRDLLIDGLRSSAKDTGPSDLSVKCPFKALPVCVVTRYTLMFEPRLTIFPLQQLRGVLARAIC